MLSPHNIGLHLFAMLSPEADSQSRCHAAICVSSMLEALVVSMLKKIPTSGHAVEQCFATYASGGLQENILLRASRQD